MGIWEHPARVPLLLGPFQVHAPILRGLMFAKGDDYPRSFKSDAGSDGGIVVAGPEGGKQQKFTTAAREARHPA